MSQFRYERNEFVVAHNTTIDYLSDYWLCVLCACVVDWNVEIWNVSRHEEMVLFVHNLHV